MVSFDELRKVAAAAGGPGAEPQHSRLKHGHSYLHNVTMAPGLMALLRVQHSA